MRTALLFLLAFAATGLSSTAAATTVWKWVDEKGITHYSDQPVPGATKIELSTGNVADARPFDTPSASASSPPDAAAPGPSYRDFEIWRPEDQQAFVNTGGQVDVEVRVEPALQPTHTLNLYLDGKLVEGFADNATSYALKDLPRGTHTVLATINELRGTRVQETATVTFIVRQESIAQPPAGPGVRPPPKPRPNNTTNKLRTTQPSYGALNGARPVINPATNRPVVAKPKPKPGKP